MGGALLARLAIMRAIVVVLAVTAACGLSTGGDNTFCPPFIVAAPVRDPHTGSCIDRVEDCGCKPCPVVPKPVEEYAACNGQCDQLSEHDCLGTTGCRVAYASDARSNTASFLGCWATETTKPPPTGACAALDVLTCPYRDDCAAWYATSSTEPQFDHCANEPAAAFSSSLDSGPRTTSNASK
jgi:hypothetical protein